MAQKYAGILEWDVKALAERIQERVSEACVEECNEKPFMSDSLTIEIEPIIFLDTDQDILLFLKLFRADEIFSSLVQRPDSSSWEEYWRTVLLQVIKKIESYNVSYALSKVRGFDRFMHKYAKHWNVGIECYHPLSLVVQLFGNADKYLLVHKVTPPWHIIESLYKHQYEGKPLGWKPLRRRTLEEVLNASRDG